MSWHTQQRVQPSKPKFLKHYYLSTTMSPSSSSDSYQGEQGIVDRHLMLCPRLAPLDTEDLIVACPKCDSFVLYCCCCSNTKGDDYWARPCHHLFTDGACIDNGQQGASAGIGATHSNSEGAGWSVPITDDVDLDQKRTNQRAELMAASLGLDLMVTVYVANCGGNDSKEKDEYSDKGEKIDKTED
ncbi:MAG: hypothetical protein LQ342_008566 [Letrouitia transgressa]|nr:MAG: hypothetical protein LQ342_008566 [Letrouitia transgressa]